VKFLYALFSGAAFVLHNIVILIREDPPVLPPNIQENAFQELFLCAQIQVQALANLMKTILPQEIWLLELISRSLFHFGAFLPVNYC
jgi:hypothetical protein